MAAPWAGYPPTADLVALSSDANLTGLDAAAQGVLRASAINAIERWTGQRFLAEGTALAPVELSLDGTGSRTLYLPRRLAQLVDVTIFGSWLTASDVRISAEGDRLSISPANVAGGTWLDRAMADMTFGEAPASFGDGPDNVRISGVWGWTADEWLAATADGLDGPGPLAAIARAILLDMEDRAPDAGAENPLAATVDQARSLGVSSISQGNLSLTLGPGGEPVVSERVQRELQGLRWRGKSVAVA
jgi:hypothetical protein